MDDDDLHYAVIRDPMPPENRVSCALESVDVLKRLLVEAMSRLGVLELRMSRERLERTPAELLLVRRDKGGNVVAGIES